MNLTPEGRRRALRWARELVVLLPFAALALFPWASFYSAGIDLTAMGAPPSAAHPFGTDNLGRDLLVRIGEAVRFGVLPLWIAVLVASAVGSMAGLCGIVASKRRRAVGLVQIVDVGAVVAASIPVGLVAFACAVWSERAGLLPVLAALSLLFCVRSYLQVRDLYRHDERLGYWTAHEALGGELATRLVRYGLVSGWRRDIVSALGFHMRAAVAIEASLSYLGFGIQEPQASFGNMLASHFDLYLKGHWQVLMVIVAALALTAAAPASLARLFVLLELRRD